MSLPDILNKIPPGVIVGLRADPYRLSQLRNVREERLLRSTGDYAKPEYVAREMKYALQLFDIHPDWPVINVTSKPIEEIASEIIALTKSRTEEAENISE